MFTTPMGRFSYTHPALPYYSFGIIQLTLFDEQHVMVASPEKALFDKIVTTSGLVLRSQKSAMSYLVENLSVDEDSLKDFDTLIMSSWIGDAPKKDSLSMLIKTINNL